MTKALLFSATVLLALPALAEPVPRLEEFLSILRQNGCSMSSDEADRILFKHGFTPDDVWPIADYLTGRGEATIEKKEGRLVLSGPVCSAG